MKFVLSTMSYFNTENWQNSSYYLEETLPAMGRFVLISITNTNYFRRRIVSKLGA
jgi:hypothetical protein